VDLLKQIPVKNKEIGRRDFIKKGSLATAALLALRLPALAETLNWRIAEGKTLLDKKLDPAWVKSLYNRGNATTYLKTKNELAYIGMPVGGIGCGCVYAGGDGRLWLWDIFNQNQTGVVYKEVPWNDFPVGKTTRILTPWDGANYVSPVKDIRPLDQGFAFKFEINGETVIKRLQSEDWDEIAFEATYPMATVHYTDNRLPVNLSAKIYSPFIPLDEDNSGLPATIYSFQITNNTDKEVKVTVTGWLENKCSLYYEKSDQFNRSNSAVQVGENWMVKEIGHDKNWADHNMELAPDFGELGVLSLNPATKVNTNAGLTDNTLFTEENREQTDQKYDEKLAGSVSNRITINAGQSGEMHYAFCWYFPNLSFSQIKNENRRYYVNKFKSVVDVAGFISQNFKNLSSLTQLWCDTWYGQSTLPHWLLERTIANASTLATTTSHRFSSGRFYGWEGVGSCEGTCTHVYQYAQAMGRLFPALERDIRERVDLGIAFHEDGHIGFRAEGDQNPAIDGQAGRVLGIYREHQISIDNSFLTRNWDKTKKAVQYIINQDKDGDGMLDTPIENTLDAKWPGEISWLVGLCLAAVKAGQLMAEEMNDMQFATACKKFVTKGKANMATELFNGEYFIHKPDPKIGKTVLGSYNTCHIDQVYGQSWAFQVGIKERIIDKDKTLSALKALWKYNFTTDVGPYIKTHKGGRAYALPGEGGIIMNTNPKNDPLPYGVKDAWQLGYFNECMSGFEHQLASHFMAEGMTDESLITVRTIHDRYHAAKRNPFNEVECSDHYARAMASYNTFITACGFEYHGPKKYMKFSPKLSKDNFKAAFTSAKGWGTYSQVMEKGVQIHQVELKYGSLELQTISLDKLKPKAKNKVTVTLDTQTIVVTHQSDDERIDINFNNNMKINTNQILLIRIG
jgi:non-lysosomal glucosylceramidase